MGGINTYREGTRDFGINTCRDRIRGVLEIDALQVDFQLRQERARQRIFALQGIQSGEHKFQRCPDGRVIRLGFQTL